MVVIDEAHELFGSRPGAVDDAERAIKRARALGIIIALATQIPDKDSLPWASPGASPTGGAFRWPVRSRTT